MKDTDKYALVKKLWDERRIHEIGQVKFLKAVVVILLAIIAAGFFYGMKNLTDQKLIPYVVEVTESQVRFAGVLQNRRLSITDAEIIYYIKRFVGNLFTISSDAVILKNNLSDVYNFTSPNCQTQISEYILSAKPFEKSISGLRVDIKYTLFEKVAEKTWRCEWIEETREKGVLKTQIAKSGTFTYSQDYPQTIRQAETNPSGLFFTEYFVSERR
jgi:type IV secretion system protein VirB5